MMGGVHKGDTRLDARVRPGTPCHLIVMLVLRRTGLDGAAGTSSSRPGNVCGPTGTTDGMLPLSEGGTDGSEALRLRKAVAALAAACAKRCRKTKEGFRLRNRSRGAAVSIGDTLRREPFARGSSMQGGEVVRDGRRGCDAVLESAGVSVPSQETERRRKTLRCVAQTGRATCETTDARTLRTPPSERTILRFRLRVHTGVEISTLPSSKMDTFASTLALAS
jgi:hypothetical protein